MQINLLLDSSQRNVPVALNVLTLVGQELRKRLLILILDFLQAFLALLGDSLLQNKNLKEAHNDLWASFCLFL